MRIKCEDGIVREFTVSRECPVTGDFNDSICCECGEYFGTHDTYLLKPEWKKHVCEPRADRGGG